MDLVTSFVVAALIFVAVSILVYFDKKKKEKEKNKPTCNQHGLHDFIVKGTDIAIVNCESKEDAKEILKFHNPTANTDDKEIIEVFNLFAPSMFNRCIVSTSEFKIKPT